MLSAEADSFRGESSGVSPLTLHAEKAILNDRKIFKKNEAAECLRWDAPLQGGFS